LEVSPIAEKRHDRINDQIFAPIVRLIAQDRTQLGIVPLREALQAAQDAGLDLVEISPQADPPVCQIRDYQKHRFQEEKRQRSGRGQKRAGKVKEMRFKLGIAEGDYQVKLRKVTDFLLQGNKAKVSLQLRGREIGQKERGIELIQRVSQDLAEIAKVDQPLSSRGRFLTILFSPEKK
jgi:translation initiation factor IF-3